MLNNMTSLSRGSIIVVLCAAAMTIGLPWDYTTLPAQQKQSYLWQQMSADTKGGSFDNPLKTLYYAGQTSYTRLMQSVTADWREPGHQKITHGQGGHALAHFNWLPNNYTGMFQKADHCVIRMANAAVPGTIAMNAYGPNLAIKCLNDGKQSANLQNLWQLDGYALLPKDTTKSCSYFEAPVGPHTPLRDDINFGLKNIFVPDFNKVDPNSLLVGVSQFALVNQSGHSVSSAQFPFSLHFQPRKEYNKVPCTFDDYISQLKNIPMSMVGKTLYDVYAIHDPWVERPHGKPDVKKIGELVLDTAFISSTYGDQQLFFEHTFWAKEQALLSADPYRQSKWIKYTGNKEWMKSEGAMLYDPWRPDAGGKCGDPCSADSDCPGVVPGPTGKCNMCWGRSTVRGGRCS